MSDTSAACFLCTPAVVTLRESAYEWSEPRTLCAPHKRDVRLDDGQSLADALIAIEPLEGGLLAGIFNPVLIDSSARRGWTDFAAGGMAIFEDRFSAQTYFEFRACEFDRNVDLLYGLHSLAAEAGALPVPATNKDVLDLLQRLAARESAAMPAALREPSRGRGAMEGLRDLVRAWQFDQHLRVLRGRNGTPWPRSAAEAHGWIACCNGVDEPWECPEVVAAMLPVLAELARRRFVTFANGAPQR
jgi:hypothetical protein